MALLAPPAPAHIASRAERPVAKTISTFAFSRPGFLARVRPALDSSSEVFAWLENHLPLEPQGKRWRHPVRHRLTQMPGMHCE